MTTPLPRLDSHGLNAPNADDFRGALRRRMSVAKANAVWAELAAEADVPRTGYLLTLDQLEALAAAFVARPGMLGLIGRDMAVRVATYKALAQGQLTEPPKARDWGREAIEKLLRGRPDRAGRVNEIADLDLFSEESRLAMDKSAKEIADRFGTKIGLVSIVLEGSQVFAGSHGLQGWVRETQGTPVEWSMCATTIRTREHYIVPDADADVIQRTNPLVTREGYGSYAGVPLITSTGQVIGAYCVLDESSRVYSDEDVAEMQGMADRLVSQLEKNRLSTTRTEQLRAHRTELAQD